MGPAFAVMRETEEERDHFVLGQYVEDLVFEIDTSKYIEYNVPSATTNLGKMVKWMIEYCMSNSYVWPNSTEFDIKYNELGIRRPTTADLLDECVSALTVLREKIISYTSMIPSGDPVPGIFIVSTETKRRATSAADKVKDDFLTSKMIKDTSSSQAIKKLPIFWDFEGLPCKGEIDLLRVNHDKRMLRIVDIKTMSGFNYFLDTNFWKYRYDFQLAYYQYGLLSSQYYQDNFKDYTLLNPMIIAVDFVTEAPLLYQLSSETMNTGENGGVTSIGRQVKGWREAIELHNFYESNGYRYPKEVVLNKYLEI